MPPTPLALVLTALAAALALPSAAGAHATPVGAEPPAGARLGAPPAEVRLALDAPLERAFLRLRVRGPDGAPVAGPATRDAADPRAVRAPVRAGGAGPYLVRWRAFSQDGHPTGGAYRLTVGGAPPAPVRDAERRVVRSDATPAHVLLRLLAIGWPVLALGLVAFRAGVVGPAYAAAGVAPPGRGRDPEGFRARAGPALTAAAGAWWAVLRVTLALGAAGLVGLPAALLWSLREGPAALGSLLGDTRWGHAWIAQALALVVTAAGAAALARRPEGARPRPGPAPALLIAPPAVALLAISWSGHASSEPDRPLNVAIDAVHNGATAAWLGGLAGLLALLPATARLAEADRVRLGAGVVVRFSALAIAAVTTLVVTGAYRALVELGALADLWETAYGRALAVKLALLAVLLAAGGYNRLVLHPRLERAALGLEPGDRGATAALRTSVRAELALALLLMVAVAALVSLDPPA